MNNGPDRTHRRRGQAVVEFALVLPVFLLLLFGAIEFGRAYLRLHLLTNATRVGARAGCMPGATENDVQTTIEEFLGATGLDSSTYNITTEVYPPDQAIPGGTPRAGGLADAEQGDRVQVLITHDFQVLSGSLIPGFEGTVQLPARCVFRHE